MLTFPPAVLRHNGAGKTTTISTLTGLIEATAGTVRIYGRSLKDDLHAIRQMTGVCPQHNVLFFSLTVQEHLFFFGKIKGLMGRKLHDAADKVLLEVMDFLMLFRYNTWKLTVCMIRLG